MNVDRASLQGLIDYLGLSIKEAAAIIGIGHDALSRKLQGRERYEVREGEIAKLAELAETVDKMVDGSLNKIREVLARHPVETDHAAPDDPPWETDRIHLLIYRHDDDLPPWAGLPFASVHRKATARIARGLRRVDLVTFDRERYHHWLGLAADTQESRADWAAREPTGRRFALDLGPNYIGAAVWATGDDKNLPKDKLAGGIEPI